MSQLTCTENKFVYVNILVLPVHCIPEIEFPTIDVMTFLVFKALGKQPGIHRHELHCQEIHSQTIVDVNSYITSDAMNSEKLCDVM